jgi:hypothetical protein
MAGIRNSLDSPVPYYRWALRLEVEIVNRPRQMLWSFQFALHESFVDHDFHLDVGESWETHQNPGPMA